MLLTQVLGDGDTARALLVCRCLQSMGSDRWFMLGTWCHLLTQTINSFASQPYDFWCVLDVIHPLPHSANVIIISLFVSSLCMIRAQKLKKAMKGMGTNDELLRRVIVRRYDQNRFRR